MPLKVNCSIETARFLNELLQYDPKFRPFPDELVKHPYFETDLTNAKPLSASLMELRREKVKCLDRSIVSGKNKLSCESGLNEISADY